MGTPIANKLLELAKKISGSFHALPVSNTINLDKTQSSNLIKFFGKKYLEKELTITGDIFDSFFYPKTYIKESQRLVAKRFGANDTLFITCGTTVANHIVIDAIVSRGDLVLFDRNSHQSLHFALDNKCAEIVYIQNYSVCSVTDRTTLNINDILNSIELAQKNDKIIKAVVLTASSYDGVIYNINEIISQVLAVNSNITFIIDEAWSAAYYSHPCLYKLTAGYAKQLHHQANIVVTQSAHKSIMALRQGSYIHSFANQTITDNLYGSRLKFHSTSPSYTILASLDLASDHMEKYGKSLVENAINSTKKIKKIIKQDKVLRNILVPDITDNLDKLSGGVAHEDPLKIHFNMQGTSLEMSKIQQELFNVTGLYFNRFNKFSFLINMHIAVKASATLRLLQFLRQKIQQDSQKIASKSSRFIISYPPGIPICTPCESLNASKIQQMNENEKSGNLILHID